jgi:hypothetical protein
VSGSAVSEHGRREHDRHQLHGRQYGSIHANGRHAMSQRLLFQVGLTPDCPARTLVNVYGCSDGEQQRNYTCTSINGGATYNWYYNGTVADVATDYCVYRRRMCSGRSVLYISCREPVLLPDYIYGVSEWRHVLCKYCGRSDL